MNRSRRQLPCIARPDRSLAVPGSGAQVPPVLDDEANCSSSRSRRAPPGRSTRRSARGQYGSGLRV